MNVVVLGSSGMLGHMIASVLREGGQFRVICPTRSELNIENPRIQDYFDIVNFDVVINCAGIIKQRIEVEDIDSVRIYKANSVFPHLLAYYCKSKNKKLIHISTDCVFNGLRGEYSEKDIPTADDDYGVSKLLGETSLPGVAMTIRTSIIGPEIKPVNFGLFEWAISMFGREVDGYTNHTFSGLTTLELARRIRNRLLTGAYNLFDLGIIHMPGEAITKYYLLKKLNDIFEIGMTVNEAATVPHCNRVLRGDKAISTASWTIPKWDEMLRDLKEYIDIEEA